MRKTSYECKHQNLRDVLLRNCHFYNLNSMKNLFLFTLFLAVCAPQVSGQNLSREEYIEKYKETAMKSMREFKIPASITLAQALLESSNGNSDLAKRSNNHFGIKCHSSWKGKKTFHDDDARQECFRVYKDVYDSYADHAEFLLRPRYAKLFDLDIDDYKSWGKGLREAGYATNPRYPQLLIKIIEDNELYKIDEEVLSGGKMDKKSKKKQRKQGSDQEENEEFDEVRLSDKPQIERTSNKVKYILAPEEQSVDDVAHLMEMGRWQIKSYNDVEEDYVFQKGERIYLTPKRYKGNEKYHVVKEGEDLWDISQEHAIKYGSLRRKNRLPKGKQPNPGDKLYLQKKRPKELE